MHKEIKNIVVSSSLEIRSLFGRGFNQKKQYPKHIIKDENTSLY